jgi:hypothetical protein
MSKDISRNVPAHQSFEIKDLRAPMACRWMIPGRWTSGLRTPAQPDQLRDGQVLRRPHGDGKSHAHRVEL